MAEPPGKIETIRWDGPMPVQNRRGSKGSARPARKAVRPARMGTFAVTPVEMTCLKSQRMWSRPVYWAWCEGQVSGLVRLA